MKKLRVTPIKSIRFPENYSLENTGITQSLITNYMLCRRCFLLSVNKWVYRDRYNTTAFGSLCHDILDKLHNFCIKNNGKIPSLKILPTWIEKFCEEFPDDLYNIKSENLEQLKGTALIMMKHYMRYYEEELRKQKFYEVEQVIEVMFEGKKLRGKVDGKFRDPAHLKWLMEHKTKSRVDEESLLLQLGFDFQNLFYITCDEIQDPEPVAGVLYNIIRNPGMYRGVNETLSDYLKKVEDDVIKRPSYYFFRYEIPYTERDKIDFKNELSQKLDEIELVVKGDLPCYRNQANCVGRFKCDFLQACSSGTMAGYYQKEILFEELHIGV